MGDMGDVWNEVKAYRKKQRDRLGVPCPQCTVRLPKAQPKILLPGQRCWCGYQDRRSGVPKEQP